MPIKNLSPKGWMPLFQKHRLPPGFEQALADLEKPTDTAHGLLAANLLAASVKTLTRQLAGQAEAVEAAEAIAALGKLVAARHKLLLRQVAVERRTALLGDSDTDREDNSPEWRKLGERLRGQLRALPGRGPEDPPLQALVATDGLQAEIFLSRKPIPAAMKTTLRHGLGAGKIHFLTGNCRWMDGFFVFELTVKMARITVQIQHALWRRAGWKNARVRVTGPVVPPAAAEAEELAIRIRAVVTRVTGLGEEIRALVAGGGPGGVAVRELLNDIADLSKRQLLEPLQAAARALENRVWAADERVAQKMLLQQEFEPLRDRLPELVDAQALDPDWVAVQARPALQLRDQISRMLATDSNATLAEIRQALTELQQLEGPLQEMHAKRLVLADFMRTRLADIEKTQALQATVDTSLALVFTSLARALQPLASPSELATASLVDVQRLVEAANIEQHEVRTCISSLFGARLAARQGATVRKQLVDEPELMEQLVRTSSGRKMLDAVVADIGDEVTDPRDAEFVIQALQTRFGAKFSGELSEDAGLRIYGAFAKVPDQDTRLNPCLAEVKRNKKIVFESWYDVKANPAEGLGPYNIVINAVRTGGILGFMGDLMVNNASTGRYRNVRNGRQINQFDATVLHEIGHSVDEKKGFMTTHGAESQYGGWLKHTQDEVAEKIGLESGFFSEFHGQSRPMLKAYLHQALGKDFDATKFRRKSEIGSTLTEADLRQDAGMLFAAAIVASQEWQTNRDPAQIPIWTLEAQKEIMLRGPAMAVVKDAIADIVLGHPFADVVAGVLAIAMRPGVDWSAMKSHRGTNACLACRIVGRRGLWTRGDGAKEFAMAGRIHQECYTGTWYSYEVAARAIRVSDYQFRSPGEWFAESYSAYYQDKLPIDHPMTPIFALDAD